MGEEFDDDMDGKTPAAHRQGPRRFGPATAPLLSSVGGGAAALATACLGGLIDVQKAQAEAAGIERHECSNSLIDTALDAQTLDARANTPKKADAGDLAGANRAITGSPRGLDDLRRHYERALALLLPGATPMQIEQPKP